MTFSKTFTETQPTTFLNLDTDDGKLLLNEISSVKLEDVTMEADSLVKQKIVDFILKYMNLKTLQKGKRTREVWESYTQTGISGVIENLFSYLEKHPQKTVLDFYYQIGLNTSSQTLSGFTVGVTPSNSNLGGKTPIQVLFQDRMDWLDEELLRLYNETPANESLFVFMPEFDLDVKLLPQVEESDAQLLVLSPTIFQDEQAKAVFYSSNLEVTEITKDEIHQVLTGKYGKTAGELYEKNKNYQRVAVVKVLHTRSGETWTGILPHLKSFGSQKDLPRILEQAHLVNLIKNCYSDGKVAMIGDWNFPINPIPGTLGLSQETISNLPFQIRESWKSWGMRMIKGLVGMSHDFDYLAKGFYVPDFIQEDIPYKERAAGIDTNSQCWVKSGKRQHLTDMIATNFGVSWFYQPELVIHPRAKNVPLIPSVGENPYMSDHPQVSLLLETRNSMINLVEFNVLANNSIGTNPFNQEPNDTFMKEYRKELGELFLMIHNSIQIKTQETEDKSSM